MVGKQVVRQMVSEEWLQEVLERRREEFDIEYGGYLSNHLAHGAIALAKLGADEGRIKTFIDRYLVKLEPSGKPSTVGAQVPLPPSVLKDLLGQRENFPFLFAHYHHLVEELGIEQAVQSSISVLAPGMVCSALHAMIHLGYACSIGHRGLVAEGLAYLHFSHVDLGASFTVSATSHRTTTFEAFLATLLESLGKASKDERLKEIITSAPEKFKDVVTSDFQRKAMALSSPESWDLLDSYLRNIPSAGENLDWFLDVALLVFVRSAREKGWDFFLAHGVTCTWATLQVARHSTSQQRSLIEKSLLRTLCVAYLIQGSPTLDEKAVVRPEDNPLWDNNTNLATNAIAQYGVDEHIYKVVQVALDRAESGRAMLLDGLYKDAAYLVLNQPSSSPFFNPPSGK